MTMTTIARSMLAALAAACLLTPPAGASTAVSDTAPRQYRADPPPKQMPAEADKLCFRLLRELAATQAGNISFSPAALEHLLLTLRYKARGSSFELLDTLPFAQPETDRAQQLHLASGIFWDKSLIPWGGSYNGLRFLPLAADPQAAAEAINQWCDKATGGQLPFIIRAGDIAPETRMLALAACHLTLPWDSPFDKARTQEGTPFHKSDGTTTPVAMMRQTAELRYAEGEGWQAVALLYRDRERPWKPLSFIGILPEGDAHSFARTLDTEQYDAIRAALRADSMQELVVELPRMELGCRLSFKDCLALPAALFRPGLELDTVSAPGLKLGDLIQQCRISLDEERTEASAVTIAPSIIVGAVPEPRRIRFDRPFLWAIDNLGSEDSPAFIGLVEEVRD